MIEDLFDIQDLMNLLGYEDFRSIKKWCEKRCISVISLGLKKYVSKQLLTQYIDNQLLTFARRLHVTKNEKSAPTEQDRSKYINSKPENEIENKYLAKYESNSKSKITTKR